MAATTFRPQQTGTMAYSQLRASTKIPPYMILPLIGLLLCSLTLYFHTVLVESQANAKQQEIIKMKEENYELQALLAELKTLPSIDLKAKELGMESVKDFHYITIPASLYNYQEKKYSAVTHKNAEIPMGF